MAAGYLVVRQWVEEHKKLNGKSLISQDEIKTLKQNVPDFKPTIIKEEFQRK